jgi:hypothetical protein
MIHERDGSGWPEENHGLEGRYANYFKVGHNAIEFLFDFGQCYQESEKAQLHTRIITSPVYAKALLDTLRQSVDQYEQIFGGIQGS